MFPNVRLLIGALFASVIALSCGFGVFAAFRVNHDPLSRLPANTAALQLIADEPVQPPANWGVPLNQEAGEAHAAHATHALIGTIVDAPVRAPARSVATGLPSVAAPTPLKAQMATAAPLTQATPAAQESMSAALHAPAAKPAPASTIAPAPAPAVTTEARQTPAAGPQTISSEPALTATAATTRAKIATAETTGRKAEPAQTPIPQIATREPAEPSTDPASPAPTVAEITGSVSEAAAIAVPPLPVARPNPSGPLAHKPVARRRVVGRRRVVREAPGPAATRFGDGNSAFREPAFQSAPAFGQSETQWRSTSKTAKNSAAANAPAWPSGQ